MGEAPTSNPAVDHTPTALGLTSGEGHRAQDLGGEPSAASWNGSSALRGSASPWFRTMTVNQGGWMDGWKAGLLEQHWWEDSSSETNIQVLRRWNEIGPSFIMAVS